MWHMIPHLVTPGPVTLIQPFYHFIVLPVPVCVCKLELEKKVREVFTIAEKARTRAFSWLKAPTSAFTFKTLLKHYAKRVLTPRSLNVKLGQRRNYHKGRAAIRHYANQTARPL